MSEVISKPSYILGLLREMDILGSLITFKSETYTSRVLVQLSCDLPSSGVDGVFKLVSVPAEIIEGQILFEVDNAVYKAHVKRAGEEFKIPSEIILCEAREIERLRREIFHHETVFIEIRGSQRKKYGELVNIDKKYVLIECSDTSSHFNLGEVVELRGYIKSGDILNRIGVINKVRKGESGYSYVVNLEYSLETKRVERNERFPVVERHIMTGRWPEDESFKFEFELVDVGYMGFKGRLRGESESLPPLGSVLTVGEMKVKAHLVWRDEDSFGCDLVKSDKRSIGDWQEYVQEKTKGSFGSYSSGVRNKRILNIFLRSGYLRKHKAYVFGLTEKIHEILPSDSRLNTWIQRYGNATSAAGKLDTHISFLRLTDFSWLIQEASSMSLEKGVGVDLILNNLEQFYYRNNHEFNLSSFIFALYDANMSFNQRFWDCLDNEPYISTYDTLVLDFQKVTSDGGRSIELKEPTFETWPEDYECLQGDIEKNILDAFNIKSEGWDPMYLRSALNESSYSLNRKVHLLIEKRKVLGVAIQFGLPTIANVTSTANHLYIIVSNDVCDFVGISKGLLSSENRQSITGVTEVVFVKKHIEPESFSPPQRRYFKLKLVQCLGLKKLVNFFRGED